MPDDAQPIGRARASFQRGFDVRDAAQARAKDTPQPGPTSIFDFVREVYDEEREARAKVLASPELGRLDPQTAALIRNLVAAGSLGGEPLRQLVASGALTKLTAGERATARAALQSPTAWRFAEALTEAARGSGKLFELDPAVRAVAVRTLALPEVLPLVESGIVEKLPAHGQLAVLEKLGAAPRDRFQKPLRPADVALATVLEPVVKHRADPDERALIVAELSRVARDELPQALARGFDPQLSLAALSLDDAQLAQLQSVVRVRNVDLAPLLKKDAAGTLRLLAKDFHGGSVLDHLAAVATQPLHPTLDRRDVLGELAKELGTVTEVDQGIGGTCTVAGVSDLLAKNAPGEYARLNAELVLRGEMKLANGDIVRPPEDAWIAPDGSRRSPTERLLQSSLMDYADGPFEKYSNVADLHFGGVRRGPRGPERNVYGGLNSAQTARVLSAVFNRPFVALGVGPPDPTTPNVAKPFRIQVQSPQELLDILEKRSGQDTLAGFDWRVAGHEVVVEKIENGRLYLREPMRQGANAFTRLESEERLQTSMTLDEARARIRDIIVPR